MLELLLETATDQCSVALARDGNVIAEVTATESYQHASHLTVFIQQVLKKAALSMTDLHAVVISDGPGSYTSLRVGAATAKGLCVALPHLRLYAVSTLAAIARSASNSGMEEMILAAIDSRRGEVFGQVFTAGASEPLTGLMNVRLSEQDWRGRLLDGAGLGRILVCGPGQNRVREALPPEDNAFTFGAPFSTSARFLLFRNRSGQHREISNYEPLYLNPPFVTRTKKKPLL